MRLVPILLLSMILLFACKGGETTSDQAAGTGGTSSATGGSSAAGGSGGQNASAPNQPPLATGGAPAAGTGGTSAGGAGTGSGGAAPSSSSTGGSAAIDAGSKDAESADAAGASTIDAFNGMCNAARWSNVSPECWSCWCSQCAETLNVATRRSMEIFECMFDEKLLVNDAFELLCEVRAGEQECVNGSTDDWDKLVAFDMCLMSLGTDTEFRACDTKCQVEYPGDVCTRYP